MADTKKDTTQIPFIVPVVRQPPSRRPADKAGKTHGAKEVAEFALSLIKRPAKEVRAELERVVEDMRAILPSVSASPVGGLVFDGFEVGLAITKEGSIGIASAGAEISVTLHFTKENTQSGS
jgi:hypothetical protein